MVHFSLQVIRGDPIREEGRAGYACRRPHGLHDVSHLQEALHVRRVGTAPGEDWIHDTFTNRAFSMDAGDFAAVLGCIDIH